MNPLLVVSGVWAGDAEVLERTLDWCAELGTQPADLVIVTDGPMNFRWNGGGFLSKRVIELPLMVDPVHNAWMEAPLRQHTRVREEYPQRAYFMMEPDSVPLTRDWVRGIMEGHGPDFLNTMSGSWVPRSGDANEPFLNGVGLYPSRYHAPQTIPPTVIYGIDRLSNTTYHPHLRFKENERMIHRWGDEEELLVQIDGSRNPIFPTDEGLKLLRKRYPGAVFFHRNKDGSLIPHLKAKPPPMYRDDFPALFTKMGYKVGLEVGVCIGTYSNHILRHWDGHLHLVDVWDGPFAGWDVPQDGQGRLEMAKAATAQWKDSVTFHRAASPGVARQFADNSLDWFYLDAHHGYKQVLDDLEGWYPKLRPGGMACGHDYQDSLVSFERPMRIPQQLRHLLTEYGVESAVREFRRRHNITSKLHVTNETDTQVRSFWWIKPEWPFHKSVDL